MKKFIVSIYRCEPNNPRSIVGVAEEVGVEGKRAFTNFDELWEILNPEKDAPGQSIRRGIHFTGKYGNEKRNEVRIRKEIPFGFTYREHNINASTIDFSKKGLGIKIFDEIPMPVGDIVNLKVRDSSAKAEVRWVNKESAPSVTMAGFQIVDGTLNIKG